MAQTRRTTWRAARSTLIIAWTFGLICLVAIPILAWLIWSRHHQLLIPIGLLVLALAGVGYAWRFGLHPKISAEDDELVIANPFRTASFDWRDIATLWPGSDGLVVVSEEQRVEAWCVQKSNRAIKADRRTRADAICDQLWQQWEQHHPPLATDEDLLVRPARPGEESTLADLERSASTAALGHIFPADSHPYPLADVTARWRSVLRDPHKQSVIALDADGPIGYGAWDQTTVLHLGVVGDRQRQGLGGRLVELITEELFADPTLPEASLWVLEDNRQARSFYRDHGWSDTDDRRPSEYPPKPIEMRMRKINPRAARRGRR